MARGVGARRSHEHAGADGADPPEHRLRPRRPLACPVRDDGAHGGRDHARDDPRAGGHLPARALPRRARRDTRGRARRARGGGPSPPPPPPPPPGRPPPPANPEAPLPPPPPAAPPARHAP